MEQEKRTVWFTACDIMQLQKLLGVALAERDLARLNLQVEKEKNKRLKTEVQNTKLGTGKVGVII